MDKRFTLDLTGRDLNTSRKAKDRVKKEKKVIKMKAIQKYFEKDYAMTSLDAFEVLNTGRYGDDPLKVQLNFTSEGFLKKAGKNYIFPIGSLIREQLTLDQDEKNNRTKDIQFGVGRTYSNTIEMRIPTGYTLEGVDNLNMSIDTPYMSFISKAILNNKQLTVTTEKIYKTSTAPQAEWNKIVDVLETAYKFSQAKVILKKG